LIRCVTAAAAASTAIESGATPPCVSQTAPTPRASACFIVSTARSASVLAT
jgi:hypothetical protein